MAVGVTAALWLHVPPSNAMKVYAASPQYMVVVVACGMVSNAIVRAITQMAFVTCEGSNQILGR